LQGTLIIFKAEYKRVVLALNNRRNLGSMGKELFVYSWRVNIFQHCLTDLFYVCSVKQSRKKTYVRITPL
jgi:hypothetical protein